MRSWLKRLYDKCVKPQTIYEMTSWFSHWNAKFRRRCNCRSFEAETIPLASRALSHKSSQWWIIFSGMPEFHLGSTLYPVSHPFRHLSAELWKEQVVELTRATRKLQIVFPSHLHLLFFFFFCFELKYMKWIIFWTAHRYESEHDLNFKRNEQSKRLKKKPEKNSGLSTQAWTFTFLYFNLILKNNKNWGRFALSYFLEKWNPCNF